MLWPLLRVRDMRALLYNEDKTLSLDLLQNCGASKIEALMKVLPSSKHRQVQNELLKLRIKPQLKETEWLDVIQDRFQGLELKESSKFYPVIKATSTEMPGQTYV